GITGVAWSGDGRYLWTASGDGTVRLWDVTSGKELCALLSLNTDNDWLVVAPDGTFDGSAGGAKVLAWREPGTSKVVIDDATRQWLHRPGLLAALLKGTRPGP